MIDPAPTPDAAEVIVIHGAFDDTVHGQSAEVARNATVPVPATDVTPALDVVSEIAQVKSA